MTLQSRPFWRLRIASEAPRYVLGALSLFGLLASARYAIAPPRPASAVAAPRGSLPDLAAEGYAVQFVRRYLTWRATEPLSSARALETFAGSQMAGAEGLVLPDVGEQRVEWAEVVQAREPALGVHVYTVAAQTSTEGTRYVTVPVERTAQGSLALDGYPGFVGAPASAPAIAPPRLRDVGDISLGVVVRRALSNYLSASMAELAADLTEGARVAPPSSPLQLISADRLQWAPGGGAVIATLQAADVLGVRYTLSYEVDVQRVQGRWEISAIESDPDA